MAGFRDDTQQKVIEDGIKEDIRIALENGRFRAGLILIYAGIDSMAFLDLPAGKEKLQKSYFVRGQTSTSSSHAHTK